ncbi:hypothetical protein OPT61_g1277 [Boeremia exigua]|uniref:Uncharacterized protein n=1 Tax=Boeremia exigua TaxID=749465 RepID=A0ACC2IQZ2_9PLEO|nr:hypothetical protein OPT61_g1277 [Boeremia exigua]
MLRRVSSAIRARMLQACQIARWRRHKMSTAEQQDCNAIRHLCECLFTVAEDAIKDLPPCEVGALYSVLRKCIIILSVFMVQNPTNTEFNTVIRDLEHYVKSRCPNSGICTTALKELATFTLTTMRLEYAVVPKYAAALADLRNLPFTYEQTCKIYDLNQEITTRISIAIFHGSLSEFRKEYSFSDMRAFTQGYRQEDRDDSYDVPMEHDPPVEYEIDDTEAEYRGCGKRIELMTYCKPDASMPRSTQCSICMAAISGSIQDQAELAVTTKCGHAFHKLCLDRWVNESGMKTSNTCPLCRTVLCKPRERVHASADVESLAGLVEADYTSASDASSIDTIITAPSRYHVNMSLFERRFADLSSFSDDAFEYNVSSHTGMSSLALDGFDEFTTYWDMIDMPHTEPGARLRRQNC